MHRTLLYFTWLSLMAVSASQMISAQDRITGKPFAKVVHLVTTHTREIGEHIISDLGRSATIMEAKGLYSGEQKNLLMVVVDSTQIYRLRDIVQLHDPEAFMIVSDAREILGKGF